MVMTVNGIFCGAGIDDKTLLHIRDASYKTCYLPGVGKFMSEKEMKFRHGDVVICKTKLFPRSFAVEYPNIISCDPLFFKVSHI